MWLTEADKSQLLLSSPHASPCSHYTNAGVWDGALASSGASKPQHASSQWDKRPADHLASKLTTDNSHNAPHTSVLYVILYDSRSFLISPLLSLRLTFPSWTLHSVFGLVVQAWQHQSDGEVSRLPRNSRGGALSTISVLGLPSRRCLLRYPSFVSFLFLYFSLVPSLWVSGTQEQRVGLQLSTSSGRFNSVCHHWESGMCVCMIVCDSKPLCQFFFLDDLWTFPICRHNKFKLTFILEYSSACNVCMKHMRFNIFPSLSNSWRVKKKKKKLPKKKNPPYAETVFGNMIFALRRSNYSSSPLVIADVWKQINSLSVQK